MGDRRSCIVLYTRRRLREGSAASAEAVRAVTTSTHALCLVLLGLALMVLAIALVPELRRARPLSHGYRDHRRGDRRCL